MDSFHHTMNGFRIDIWDFPFLILCFGILWNSHSLVEFNITLLIVIFCLVIIWIGDKLNIRYIKKPLQYVIIYFCILSHPSNTPVITFLLLYPLIEELLVGSKRGQLSITLVSSIICTVLIIEPRSVAEALGCEFLLGMVVYFNNILRKRDEQKHIITEALETCFSDTGLSDHPYIVYLQLIKQWNTTMEFGRLSEIDTYILRNNLFFLINASRFKYNRKLILDEKALAKLDTKKYLRIQQGEVMNMFFQIELKDTYIIKYRISDTNNIAFYDVHYLRKLLGYISRRIVHLLAFSYNLKSKETKLYEESRTRKDYIDKAVGVMHFIRNRLSPIANLLEFLKLTTDEKAAIPDKYKGDMIKSADNDYKQIKRYADDMLDKEMYPFADSEMEEIDLEKVLTYLAETVETHLRIYADYSLLETSGSSDIKITVNYFDLKTIIMDWISNMEKYGSDYIVKGLLKKDRLIFIFQNLVQGKELASLVNAINSDSRESRHTRKKTHGISNIREMCGRNNISLKASGTKSTEEEMRKEYIELMLAIPLSNEKENTGS